jgi:hypothetical protein
MLQRTLFTSQDTNSLCQRWLAKHWETPDERLAGCSAACLMHKKCCRRQGCCSTAAAAAIPTTATSRLLMPEIRLSRQLLPTLKHVCKLTPATAPLLVCSTHVNPSTVPAAVIGAAAAVSASAVS